MRKIGLGFLLLLLAVPSYAQFPFSSKAIREFNNALTQGSIFGSPRYATAALPLCDGSAGGLLNTGAVAFDTTAGVLKFCTGSAWSSAAGGVSLSGTNVWTAQNTFNDGASGLTVANVADATKLLKFDLSTMTTGTTANLQIGPTGQIRAPLDGTAAIPALSFSTHNNTGLSVSGGLLQLSQGGTAGMLVAATQLYAVSNGTAAAPVWTFNSFTTTGLFGVAGPILGVTVNGAESFRVDNNQHIRLTKATAPTVTANCGATPTVTGTDQAFQLNVGTGGTATTCTVTFQTAWGFKPVCVVSDETNQVTSTTAVPSSATIVITASTAWTASSILDVICFGNQ